MRIPISYTAATCQLFLVFLPSHAAAVVGVSDFACYLSNNNNMLDRMFSLLFSPIGSYYNVPMFG